MPEPDPPPAFSPAERAADPILAGEDTNALFEACWRARNHARRERRRARTPLRLMSAFSAGGECDPVARGLVLACPTCLAAGPLARRNAARWEALAQGADEAFEGYFRRQIAEDPDG